MTSVAKQLLDDISELIELSADTVKVLDTMLPNSLKEAGSVESYQAVSNLADDCLLDLNNHCRS